MSLSMFNATVPPVLQVLSSLSAIIDKAVAHCEARKIDPSVLLNARLFPDMHPLRAQVQIVTDQAKGVVARLAGLEVPSYPDTETSFEELKARLARTIDFVSSISPAQLDGSDTREITLKLGAREVTFTGERYLTKFVNPNLYFHAATAFGILRHNGVEIGKRDFLGGL